jgi:hypothetical protein
MKRAYDEVADVYPFDELPRELLGAILGWSDRPALGMVSQRWFHAVTEPSVDWLAAFARRASPWAGFSMLMTGAGADWHTVTTVYMGNYVQEVTRLLDEQRHRDSGLRQHLALFLLRALDEYAALADVKDGVCAVNRTALLQCGLYYLRDLTDKPLAAAHFHPRDFRINFFEAGHTYMLAVKHQPSGLWCLATNVESTLPGVWSRALISTTGMNHALFEPFVEDTVIERMRRSRNFNDPVLNKDYCGDSVETIKAKWQHRRENGTWCHRQLELHCNALPHELQGRREWEHYAKYESEWVAGQWEPYATEKLVYDEELMLTGSIDMLYWPADPAQRQRDADGRLSIWLADWKFAKDLLRPNSWQRGLVAGVTDDLEDCKISHYRVQLLQYTAPLERHYQMVVQHISIVGLEAAQADYIKYDVPREDWRIAALRAYRLKCVQAQKSEWLPGLPGHVAYSHERYTCAVENPAPPHEDNTSS